MGLTLAEKIIKDHTKQENLLKGSEIDVVIDQTLTQDSTGTMCYLQLEAMNISRVKTKRSVAYIDHNMLQEGFENADDHRYIQSVASKYGIYFSRPGNGICHQVHLERFGVPGQTLLGSDSHTPTGGALGMLAMGAGGLDVAVAMAGGAYAIKMPRIFQVNLTNSLRKGVSAKDIILEVLRQLSVKGGVGKIIEYAGDGVSSLTVPERATICNMGAELGATTSIFPSDEQTRAFLRAQGREECYKPLSADEDAHYDEVLHIDLDKLVPLAACPHSPDNVKPISEIGNIRVDQVAIGSCTNSSYQDMVKVARILKGKKAAEHVSLVISPGSKQVLSMLARSGHLADMIDAGARILESGCGPCIGMGQAPATDAVSLRTFNRNFKGRCGTDSAQVYIVSPETAATSAVTGYLSDPATLEVDIDVSMPEEYFNLDNMIVSPSDTPETVEVVRGPNIKPFPLNKKMEDNISGKVLIKVEDNITTDHIMPSNAKLLPYRSNIPYLSEYCLAPCDKDFSKRAKENDGGFIIAGENYGQGSSREHAALTPLYLGIKAVIAKSFARIHKDNLINAGIIPLIFDDPADYDAISQMDEFQIEDAIRQVTAKEVNFTAGGGRKIKLRLEASDKDVKILLCGGKINAMREA